MASNHPPDPPAPPAVDIDPEALRSLWGLAGESGADLIGELIEVFGANTAQTLASLRDCFSRGDTASAKRLAHSLAGSSLTLGARGIGALARQIEACAQQVPPGDATALVDATAVLLESTLAALRTAREELVRNQPPSVWSGYDPPTHR